MTIEDGSIVGGLYGAVAEFMSMQPVPLPIRPVAIPDRYVSQGTQEELRTECGLSTAAILSRIREEMQFLYKKV